MKPRVIALAAVAFISAAALRAADKATITVTNDLSIARPSETVTIPWAEVNKALPKAMIQHIAVKDAKGNALPFQVTNVAPEAKDPKGEGVAYGDLIFQHDFAAGEKSATFTVERSEAISPVFPAKVFARYVPERLDDFAWENDKVAHRTYGPALGAPDTENRNKEVLVTSGLDIWCKRVPYLVVDRWYNKGHDHYHHDEGEGMDMYNVGTSRGAGGTGVWDGSKLYVGRNYAKWKVIANGPIRAIFELTYDAWDAGNGVKVSEVKRFITDAGNNFDFMESTFKVEGATEATIGIGLFKNSADKGEMAENKITVGKPQADAALVQWEAQPRNGSIGEAIIVSDGTFTGYAEDDKNQIILAKVASGKTLHYLIGSGWSKAGEFTTPEAWNAYVTASAARAKSPLKVSIAAQ